MQWHVYWCLEVDCDNVKCVCLLESVGFDRYSSVIQFVAAHGGSVAN